MSVESTLSIIKPDAISKNSIGEILDRFEKNGLEIIACKMLHLSKEQAKKFYNVHKDKQFYENLVSFMTSGPILVQVLQGENAIKRNREIMGATNPDEAENGTIRKDFASSIDENAVHGSDSKENAEIEIKFFFDKEDLCPRTR
tara:strand:- start:320 stop:751 length:432 start_codon:yes stop_codon:yes gene_type:complete